MEASGTITSDQTPNEGTVANALDELEKEGALDPQSGEDIKGVTTADLDAKRTKEADYTVIAGSSADGPYEVLGTYKGRSQKDARAAAVEENHDLKQAILNGREVWTAALAHFNPVKAGATQREPELTI